MLLYPQCHTSQTVACAVFCSVGPGVAMVLGKLQVPGRPTDLVIVGQGPIALAVGAGGVVWTFFFSRLFLSSFSLSGKRPDID